MAGSRTPYGGDVLSPEQRHLCMARNQGKNTKPEVSLRKACFALGLRYVVHPKLFGRPDFAFPRSRVAVFVDGCFWHACPLHYQAPATRADFWRAKIDRNRSRDTEVTARLSRDGWTVLRVWEHEVRSDLPTAVSRIVGMIK